MSAAEPFCPPACLTRMTTHIPTFRREPRGAPRFLLMLTGVTLITACADRPESANDAVANVSTACTDSLARVVTALLTDVHKQNPVPGISAAVFQPENMSAPVAIAVGRTALVDGRALRPDDRFLAGSVGKMFFAALTLQRSADGGFALDRPLRDILPGVDIAAFAWITPRMLLRHRSGIGEYDGHFMQSLITDPLRPRRANDWLDVIRRTPPRAADTARFRYSDLNYVLLAMALDRAIPSGVYRAIAESYLTPLDLRETVPSNAPRIERLVSGYDGAGSMFGRDAMMEDGVLVYNPQFEFGGGGFASTPGDLARWMAAFRQGYAFPDSLWPMVRERPVGTPDSVHAWRGLGLHVDSTTAGWTYGHSGYMPGYVSWVRWYDPLQLSVAIQTNASDTIRLKDDGFAWADSIALRASRVCPARR